MSREVMQQALDAIGSAYREHFVHTHGSTRNELQGAANAIRAELAKPAAVPDTCRQKLKKEGKPYPRSSCNFCGQLSPRWRGCDAMLYAAPQPPAPAVDASPWGDLFYEVRDNILHGRGHLEGVLDNDQTNAVLDEIDRLDHECLPAVSPVDVEAVRKVITYLRAMDGGKLGFINDRADQLARAIGDKPND